MADATDIMVKGIGGVLADTPPGRMLEAAKKRMKEAEAEEERRNKLLDYDPELIPNLRYSPQDFYELVLKNMDNLEVPGLEPTFVTMGQGGPATPQRLYLQLRRNRIFIEICAMQFGTGFFVSRRVFERRIRGPVIRLLVGLFILLHVAGFCAMQFGWVLGVVMFTGVIALLWSLMRLASKNIADTLDRVLSDMPLIGSVYEMIFHPVTFFTEDTNRAYREVTKAAVNEAKRQIKEQHGSRSAGSDSAPAVDNLHQR